MSAQSGDGTLDRHTRARGPLAEAHANIVVSEGRPDGFRLRIGFDGCFVGCGILYQLDEFGPSQVCYVEKVAGSGRGSG